MSRDATRCCHLFGWSEIGNVEVLPGPFTLLISLTAALLALQLQISSIARSKAVYTAQPLRALCTKSRDTMVV